MVVFQAVNSGKSYCRLSLPGTDFQCRQLSLFRSFWRVHVNVLVRTLRCFLELSLLQLCLLARTGVLRSSLLASCGTPSGWVPDRLRNAGQPLCVQAWKQKRLLGREIKLSSENCMGVRPDTRMGTVLGFLLCPSAVACCGLCSFVWEIAEASCHSADVVFSSCCSSYPTMPNCWRGSPDSTIICFTWVTWPNSRSNLPGGCICIPARRACLWWWRL